MARAFSTFVEVVIRDYRSVGLTLCDGGSTLTELLRRANLSAGQEVMVVPIAEWKRLTGQDVSTDATFDRIYECCGDNFCESCRAIALGE